MKNLKKKILNILAPVLGAGAIAVCPACWAGSAALLTYLGLGALIPVWRWLAVIVLLLAFAGFVLDYRYHKKLYPSFILVLGGIILFLGRYVFGGEGFGGWPIWGSGALIIILAVVLNKRLFSEPQSVDKANKLFTCPACKFDYAEKAWADKCEAWCTEHKSCNLDIITHAINH